jgi:N-formylglutamate amidohydrolase
VNHGFPSRIRTFLVVLGGLWIAAGSLLAQTYIAGQTYFGRNNYIEYLAGNMPVIIAAPHGGSLTPAELPDRTTGTTTTDTNTEDLARRIQQAFSDRFGGYPHVIICRLDRVKIDCNREIVEGAQGNALTEISWNDFQNFLNAAGQTVTNQFSRGLFLDIHGHGHTLQRLELGYLLSASELDETDATLNAANAGNGSSIRHLDGISPQTFAQLLRGTGSLGGLLATAGYPSVPSPAIPSPGSDPYFNGGYNTAHHGSLSAGTVSAIQIECNYTGVRDTVTARTNFAAHLASVVETYFTDQFALNLYDGQPGLSNLGNMIVNEDTSTGVIPFSVNDTATPAASLVVEASSSNTTLVPVANIVFGGSGANRTMNVTPAANRFGTATLTVTVTDTDGRYATRTFVLTVNSVNDPPGISNVTSKSMQEDTTIGPIAVTVGDVDDVDGQLILTATSSNTTLVPNANIVLGGFGSPNRTVTITPAPNRNGSTVITLTVSDGSLTDTDTFTLTVTPDTPFTNWQQASFGANWNNSAIAGDLVDVEKDGLSNLLEYALGGDPNVASANPSPLASSTTGRLKITFTRVLANTDIIMTVQGADSPSGPWTDLASSVNGAATAPLVGGVTVAETGSGAIRSVEVSDLYLTTNPAHPRRFMRVRVQR